MVTTSTTCSTRAGAFSSHGVADGAGLITRTYYALVASDHDTPRATAEFADEVAAAFRLAFIRKATVPLVPEPVDAAIEQATDRIVHRLLDEPDADLRTDILPAFYRAVADTYCAHLAAGGVPGDVGIWIEDDDDGGIAPTP